MEALWVWGIDVIHIVQQIRSPFADLFFKFISSLGAMFFYMTILPLIYWCINKKYGARIMIFFLFSSWMNSILKDCINHPRPYSLDESVKIGTAGGPGIPSGHAQQSVVVWGSLALILKNRVFTFTASAVILLISFSRIYLGVHFPTDVFAGWLIGVVILLFWQVFDIIEDRIVSINPVLLTAAAVIVPSLLSLIIASKNSVMSMGALSGFCTGLIIEKKYIVFKSSLSFKSSIVRYISGASMLILIFLSGKILFSKNTSYYFMYVFVHTWIMFFWISAGAPWFYKKFRI